MLLHNDRSRTAYRLLQGVSLNGNGVDITPSVHRSSSVTNVVFHNPFKPPDPSSPFMAKGPALKSVMPGILHSNLSTEVDFQNGRSQFDPCQMAKFYPTKDVETQKLTAQMLPMPMPGSTRIGYTYFRDPVTINGSPKERFDVLPSNSQLLRNSWNIWFVECRLGGDGIASKELLRAQALCGGSSEGIRRDAFANAVIDMSLPLLQVISGKQIKEMFALAEITATEKKPVVPDHEYGNAWATYDFRSDEHTSGRDTARAWYEMRSYETKRRDVVVAERLRNWLFPCGDVKKMMQSFWAQGLFGIWAKSPCCFFTQRYDISTYSGTRENCNPLLSSRRDGKPFLRINGFMSRHSQEICQIILRRDPPRPVSIPPSGEGQPTSG